jgi:hypothetical protein
MFYGPFHAAEQRCKERICVSAERQQLSDVARSLGTAQGIRKKHLPLLLIVAMQRNLKGFPQRQHCQSAWQRHKKREKFSALAWEDMNSFIVHPPA